jgi:hypothetical protein
VLPANQKGVAYALPGGLATIRAGLAAAGIHSLQQLVAAEVDRDAQMQAALAGMFGPPEQQQQQQQQQRIVSMMWKQARQKEGQQRLAEQANRLWGQNMCSMQCGSLAAKRCVRQCCGECCRKAAAAAAAAAEPRVEPCIRHKAAKGAADAAAAAGGGEAAEVEAEDAGAVVQLDLHVDADAA